MYTWASPGTELWEFLVRLSELWEFLIRLGEALLS